MRHLAIVALLFAGCASVQTADLAIVAPRMLDVVSGEMHEQRAVLIADGKIVAIEPASAAARAKTQLLLPAETTLLPGFIDAHVHLAWDGAPAADAARATLNAGFTTVRNLGTTGTADVELRDAIAAGDPGPRMLIARTGIGGPGGICERTFGAPGVATEADGRARVRSLIAEGANVIKICTGGGVFGGPRDVEARELDEAVAKAIVDEAHTHGLRVAAHAQGPAAIRAAANAGVDSIEHGGLIDAESARLLAARGIPLIPTLARLGERRGPTIERMKVARANGVRFVFGTDGGVLPHGENAKELAALIEVGLTPLEAIRSATTDAAKLLGIEAHAGTIATGRAADLVAVCGDARTRAPEVALVIARGKIVRDDTRRCGGS